MSEHKATVRWSREGRGFVVESYEDGAVGHLEKNVQGKMAITHVELHPKINFGGAKQPAPTDLEWLHDKGPACGMGLRVSGVRSQRGPLPPCDAHKECFIANSVTTDVRVAPA